MLSKASSTGLVLQRLDLLCGFAGFQVTRFKYEWQILSGHLFVWFGFSYINYLQVSVFAQRKESFSHAGGMLSPRGL